MKKALITGITGQDGSYLAELLLGKGYEVYGIIRRSSSFNTGRIDHLYRDPHDGNVRLRLLYGDLNDASSINKVLEKVQPDEVYNLGAQSHVRVSFDVPEYSGLKSGMSASADIITDKRSNVLLVPNRAIEQDSSGNPVVQVMVDEQIEERPIVIGLSDGFPDTVRTRSASRNPFPPRSG